MTLRKLGKSVRQQVADDETFKDGQDQLVKQMQLLNDYMALMTNEVEPPTETDEIL